MTATTARSPEFVRDKHTRHLRHEVGRAISDYRMIEDGDRIMICLSGGKDSYALLDILLDLQARAPVRFELLAVHLDQKQPGYDAQVLPTYLRALGVPFKILEQNTYSVVKRVIPEGRTMCGLCSRLRRGALYAAATLEGCNKIALGHHCDDIVETLLLNLFHQATLKAMPPKLLSDDGKHIVIRPLAYCREEAIAAFAADRGFPIIPCNLCGSQPGLQRTAIKAMLAEWDRQQPGRVENVFRALTHVVPSQLADRNLFDFANLGAISGDEAADTDSPCEPAMTEQ